MRKIKKVLLFICYLFATMTALADSAVKSGNASVLKEAGANFSVEIDFAHATSTHQGDMYEAIALGQLFRGHRALISSTKGLTGHECWMAGASEAVYSVLMMQHGFVAPNLNFEHPDEYSEGLNITPVTVDTPVDTVLSNSFGFGGTNSALVLQNIKD